MSNLEKALEAHRSGDLVTAERLYLECIRETDSFEARQLLGLVYSRQQKPDLAIQYMRDSLRAEPRQPHVHNNLANCLKRTGDFEGAVEHYLAALKQNPDYQEARRNLASLHLDLREYEMAEEVIMAGLQQSPGDPSLLNLLGLAKQGRNDYNAAVESYSKALDAKPDFSIARHNLGVAYRLNNRPNQALACYGMLIDKGMESFQLFQNMGNAYADLGRLEEAINCYRKVLAHNPLYVDAHHNLSTLLWSLGDDENFLDSYEQAFARGQINDELALSYIETLLTVERPRDAFEFLARNNVTDPWDARYCDFFARCHLALGNLDEALRFHDRACQFDNAPSVYTVNHAVTLMVADRIAEAQSLLEPINTAEPDNQMALAYLSLCWRHTGDDRGKSVNDYANLVGEFDLPVPDGYVDIAGFNRHLNDYLTGLHTSKHHPYEQTLRGGTQTQGNLFGRDDDVVVALAAAIRQTIDLYLQTLRANGSILPAFRHTNRFEFSASWSVRLKREGFHTMHFHPMGRISSAYYVDLPDEIGDGSDRSGWIKFGEPDRDFPAGFQAEHFARPRAGKLVLFPSYMWHGTVPFESDHPRTTVAFDVIPVDG